MACQTHPGPRIIHIRTVHEGEALDKMVCRTQDYPCTIYAGKELDKMACQSQDYPWAVHAREEYGLSYWSWSQNYPWTVNAGEDKIACRTDPGPRIISIHCPCRRDT